MFMQYVNVLTHVVVDAQGDSGSPLVCRDKRNVWTLAGIVSWSVADGDDECASLGVFTEVAAFRAWITDILTNN